MLYRKLAASNRTIPVMARKTLTLIAEAKSKNDEDIHPRDGTLTEIVSFVSSTHDRIVQTATINNG